MVTLPRGCAKSIATGKRIRPLAGRKRCRRASAMCTTRRAIEVALSSRVSSASPQQQTFTCFEDSSFIYCLNNNNNNNTMSPSTTTATTLLYSSPTGNRARSCLHDSSSPNTTSSDSFLSSSCSSANSGQPTTLESNSLTDHWNTSGSLGCISALDYWHLGSSSDSSSSNSDYSSPAAPQASNHLPQPTHNPSATTQNHHLNHLIPHPLPLQHQQQQQQCSLAGQDPVYLDDVQVFHNLLMRESGELKRRPALSEQPLKGRLRHLLLSWMLKVCEHQLCQDEIFPLATMILDKFLLYKPLSTSGKLRESSELGDQSAAAQQGASKEEPTDELAMRQMYLFAACALLLATKLRQTPKLSVHSLAELSGRELPLELRKEEIIEGELLLLTTLKWDLVSLVAPNDFLALLMGKCKRLLLAQRAPANEESRVLRHTQSLLELCLMDSKLSQNPPSALAMCSMAVAIDGLSAREKSCGYLTDIVTQIYEATHKVNELKTMIDVASQIEKYVQTLLTSSIDD